MRVDITLPEELVTSLDAECKRTHWTRSEYLRNLLRMSLDVKGGQSKVPIIGGTPQVVEQVGTTNTYISKAPSKINKLTNKGRQCLHGRVIGSEYCARCPGGVAR